MVRFALIEATRFLDSIFMLRAPDTTLRITSASNSLSAASTHSGDLLWVLAGTTVPQVYLLFEITTAKLHFDRYSFYCSSYIGVGKHEHWLAK